MAPILSVKFKIGVAASPSIMSNATDAFVTSSWVYSLVRWSTYSVPWGVLKPGPFQNKESSSSPACAATLARAPSVYSTAPRFPPPSVSEASYKSSTSKMAPWSTPTSRHWATNAPKLSRSRISRVAGGYCRWITIVSARSPLMTCISSHRTIPLFNAAANLSTVGKTVFSRRFEGDFALACSIQAQACSFRRMNCMASCCWASYFVDRALARIACWPWTTLCCSFRSRLS